MEKDLGITVARQFIQDIVFTLIDYTDLSDHVKISNPISELSRILKSHNLKEHCNARIIIETGVDTHFPVFVVGIYYGDQKIGEGSGYSVKTAKTDAFENTVFSILEDNVDLKSLKSDIIPDEDISCEQSKRSRPSLA